MKHLNRLPTVAWLAVCLALAVALFPSGVGADQNLAPTPSVLQLMSTPRPPLKGIDVTGQFMLTATLTTKDGKAVSNAPISFYEQSDLFGAREALLGSATTDSTGAATIIYQPAQTGNKTLIARFIGSDTVTAANVTETLEVKTAVSPYTVKPLPFGQISEYLGVGVGILVTTTWIILLRVLVGAVLGVRGAAAGRSSATGKATASDEVAPHVATTG